jgi:hypothetical protein
MKVQPPATDAWKRQVPKGISKTSSSKLSGFARKPLDLRGDCSSESRDYYERIGRKSVPPLSAFLQPCMWVREGGGFAIASFV